MVFGCSKLGSHMIISLQSTPPHQKITSNRNTKIVMSICEKSLVMCNFMGQTTIPQSIRKIYKIYDISKYRSCCAPTISIISSAGNVKIDMWSPNW